MKVINTESCTLVIDEPNNKVIKIFKPYWMKKCPWMIKNEVRALKKLKESKHVPNFISSDENSVTMEYAGSISTSTNEVRNPYDKYDVRHYEHIPDNFEEQVEEILNDLEKAELRHSDINGQHFLIKDGVVNLIDFELSLEFEEPEPKGYPQTQGIEAKTRNIDEPIDDKLMAHRAIENLRGKGIQKIYSALGKLKNRNQYHELPFKIPQKVDRRYLTSRIEMLESVYDFNHAVIKDGKRTLKGKTGIDLGCNIGGLTFALAMKGAKMTGVDIIKENIDIANACEDYYCLNTKFINSDIVDYVNDMPECFTTDFCLLLATWHWIVRQHGLKIGTDILKKISHSCDTMFIEITFGEEEGLNGTGETMVEAKLTNEKELIDFIIKNTEYNEVKKIGTCIGWGNRPTFICTKLNQKK